MRLFDRFQLDGKVAIITGGAGLLGVKHAEAIAEAGGSPVLWDINEKAVTQCAGRIANEYEVRCSGMTVDVTNPDSIKNGLRRTLSQLQRVDILINNAANDPKVNRGQHFAWSRLENFTIDLWQKDLSVGLTGSFLCSQIIGGYMAQNKGGVILNIASDLGLIAPDQRIYRQKHLKEEEQPVKPVTYSVIKHGVIGLTKYLATYWA